MLSYLRCIKSHRGSNDPECRDLSKSYLSCRMDRYVHRHFLLRYRPAALPELLPCFHIESALRRKQGRGHPLPISTCQSTFTLDQVVGTASVKPREAMQHLAFLPACRLLNPTAVESATFRPFGDMVQHNISAPLPHLHILLSHRYPAASGYSSSPPDTDPATTYR
jgi:hypothetical protein